MIDECENKNKKMCHSEEVDVMPLTLDGDVGDRIVAYWQGMFLYSGFIHSLCIVVVSAFGVE